MNKKNFQSLVIIIFLNSLSINYFAQCLNGGCGAQMVPNPDFEILTATTNTSTPGSQVIDITVTPVQSWYGTDPSGGSTPDYTNYFGTTPTGAGVYNTACMTGNGEAGVFTKTPGANSREYIQAQLASPLIANQQYCFSMVVKGRQGAAGNLLSQCDGMGVWFHNIGMINIQTMNGGNQFLGPGSTINASPQIQNPTGNMIGIACQTITGTFCAQGGENYIVIGNFRTDATTTLIGGTSNYMYIDNVSLKESCNTPLNASVVATPSVICSGACSTLSASVTGGSAPYTYTWQPGGQNTSTISVCPSSTTTYTLFTNSTGTCLLPQTFSTTTTVLVNSSASITVNSTTICAGGSATLTASGASNYTWSPSVTLSSSSGSVVIASPGSNTTYVVTGGVGTCTSSATSTVTVGSALSLVSPSVAICTGASATLTVNGASTYTWSADPSLNTTNGATVIATPSTNTTYTVMGSSGACTGTTTVDVSINNTPTVSVNSATICNGSSVILTALGATTYTWANSVGLNSTTGTTVSANPTTTTIYTVTGFNGCLGTNTSTVSVIPTLTVTVNSSTICSGGTATLIANGASTYNWSPAATLSSSTGSLVTANPAASTVYTIIGSSGTCTSSITSSVTVIPPVSVTVSSVAICAGSAATLIASGATTYTWSNAATLNTPNGTNVIATPSINTTYTVIGTNASCTGSTAVNVIINPTPTISVNSATICLGSSALLTASGATLYAWANPGLGSVSGPTVTVAPLATTIYTVIGVNLCLGTNTATVTVIPNPIITVNSATVCAGGSTTLTASGAINYTWSPAATLNSSNGTSVIATPSLTTTYNIIGSVGTCTSSTTSSVTVIPSLSITVSSSSICLGNATTLTASGGSTYTWSPVSTLNSSNGTSVIATPITNTTYTITGASGSCTGTTTANVLVNPIPIISVSSGTICSGNFIILSASGAATYSWSNGATTQTISVSPATTTNYSVLGSSNTCSNSANGFVTVEPTPTITVSSDVTIIAGTQATLSASTNGTLFNWSPALGLTCATCSSIIVSPSVTTQYCVSTTLGSCSNSACINVDVEPPCYSNTDYGTATAFTPNGDGINDLFCLTGWQDCTTNFNIVIYNRWGEKVFETDDITFCWDGTYLGQPLDPAVFVFYIKAEIIKVGAITKKGNITLIK